MSVRLAPYPEYKDSGLPWLGKIPTHWEVRRNGRLFAQRNQTGFADLPILEVSLKTGVRVRDFGGSGRKQVMSDRDKYKRAAKGDLAYNMMRMWQGAVGVSPADGLVSPAYVVARPFPEVTAKYFEFLFRTAAFMDEVDKYSRGIVKDRNRLYWDDFKRMPSVFPPTAEQKQIAGFLGAHGRAVNRLIRAKRRLIELLNEQKQAIIHQAVTRGLDPNVRLKASGVEWIGDVPEQWDVTSLRLRYSVELGKMLDTKRISGVHLVPYLRNTDVQWDRINTEDLPTMDIRKDEYDRYTVREGDLLVCEGGEVGRSAIWNGQVPRCGYQKALHRLRPLNDSCDFPRYLFYLMFAVSKYGVFVADGSENTIAHLTAVKLRRHRFAFPLKSEQIDIVNYLDDTIGRIDRASSRTRREIELLSEYRARLVADVVIGKLDVRDVELSALAELGPPAGFDIAGDAEAEAMDDTEEPFKQESME